MKTIQIFILMYFCCLSINAQESIIERYTKFDCDSMMLCSKSFLDNKSKNSCISKVIYKGNIVLSSKEISCIYNIPVEKSTADNIRLSSKKAIILIKNNDCEILSFDRLIKQKSNITNNYSSEEYMYKTYENVGIFNSQYSDVGLYTIPGIDMTDAIGIVLLTSNDRFNKLNFTKNSVIIYSDTINDCGMVLKYVGIDLDGDKNNDIYFRKSEPYAINCLDEAFMSNDISAFILRNRQLYETGMYWNSQEGIEGY